MSSMWTPYRNFIKTEIPARMKNAIEAELNRQDCIFNLNEYEWAMINISNKIADWLIIKWIDSGYIQRLPKVGKTTISNTIDAISANLKNI